MSWEDVKKEMVNEKGLSEEAADQIGEYVSMQGETFPKFTTRSETSVVSLSTDQLFLIQCFPQGFLRLWWISLEHFGRNCGEYNM